MNRIEFNRTNGNIPRTLPGQDHISGYIAYVSTLPTGFGETDRIQLISTLESAEKLGITAEADQWEIKVLHYQLSEVFRLNPAIVLYLGLFAKPSAASYTYSEVKQLQNFASGKLRQVAVYCGDVELAAEQVTALQGIATTLETQDQPLSILYAPKVTSVTNLDKELAGAGKRNVSIVIGQDGSGLESRLYADNKNTGKASVSGLGIVLGILSRSGVQQSIAEVKSFPAGIDVPAFGDGTLYRSLDSAVVDNLDEARYLFFVTYAGLSGSYLNDSHTMDEAVSDYAYIENVRTMDKAVRGIRAALLPELAGNLYIDADTGQMASYTVEHLQDIANKPLEDMKKAGELSGYSVEIDPAQNVLATSEVEFVIKPVGVGVMRRVSVKIGYATSI